ncbi:hypothetical protein GH714_039503 [Hevea brasiliensis]|uniref:DUF4216 domain-containing protein n=1 Tax=Hevea brasiliensis TaxID=3981 RepID=A0A6A6NKJ3_HEVBR|nr:hypothetical protein GH714_039503 [Hevea brasiliensis]
MDSNEASVGEEPKGDATMFYHLLREAKEKLHPECELSKLAAIKLLHMKSFHLWTNRSFDDLLGLLWELIPNGKQNLPESYSSARNQKIRQSQNSGVMSRGDNNSPDKEYYGTLMDVWELQYSGRNQISLFKCEWFDVRHKETGYIVMASVSKRKKNNRKMPPGLKSCISSAHDDAEIGEVPYASEVWMATHRFLYEQGQTQWHDPESSRIYEEMQRIEKQPTNDNETGPTPDDILKEVFGVRYGYVHGKGLGYKASTRGMACGSRNEELNELRDEVARLNAHLKEQEQHNNEIAQLNARLKEQEERNLEFFKRFESVIGYKSSESQDMTID